MAMSELWDEELSDEQRDALIEKVIARIHRHKLEAPAIFALESHKPLAFFGSSMALTFSPFLIGLLGYDNFNDYSRLFSKRENWDLIVERLEASIKASSSVEETLAS